MELLLSLLKKVDALFKVEAFLSLKDIIVEPLIQYSQKVPSVKDAVNSLLKSFLSSYVGNNELYEKIYNAVYPHANLSNSINTKLIVQEGLDVTVSNIDDVKSIQHESDKCNFTAPGVKTKRLRKKEPNIVNTVVENGEEYVVVNSNWKFNPKKLTENQKEKLKKKREDIPALYQDLSQSQDEFKIKVWKPDSQDTSTTSSKSASKSGSEDVSTILKNLPSSEVVPKIMKSILSDTKKEPVHQAGEEVCNNEFPKQVRAVKGLKTPRLALKDRVYRNVRNLMEKSGLRNENEMPVHISDGNKTPNAMNNASISMVNSERPSRHIKKPKKFEGSEVFAIKKRERCKTDTRPGITDVLELTEEKLNLINQINIDVEKVEHSEITPLASSVTTNEKERKSVLKESVSDTTENVLLIDGQNEQILEKNEPITEQTCEKIIVDTNVPEINLSISPDGLVKHGYNIPITNPIDNSPKSSTPKATKERKEIDHQSVKKKRSRIEKQLMIDMVEGHPLLQTPKEERFTRNKISNLTNVVKRKSFAEKTNRVLPKCIGKSDRKKKKAVNSASTSTNYLATSVTVTETQGRLSVSSDDLPVSEDIIESSQDSSITTIPVKSAKNSGVKVPVVMVRESKEMKSLLLSFDKQARLIDSDNLIISLSDTTSPQPDDISSPNKIHIVIKSDKSKPLTEKIKSSDTQSKLDDYFDDSGSSQKESDDISLPKNKTMREEKTELELTENMDTEPFEGKDCSSDVIIIDGDMTPTVIVNIEEQSNVGPETLEIAEADTEPIDLVSLIPNAVQDNVKNTETEDENLKCDTVTIKEVLTLTISGGAEASSTSLVEPNTACSPLKHETQKKKDFLNDTFEISPIKILSPMREEKSSSPETSSDYVVIKLTSPVQSNGEPFSEKCDSPEIFTEEKNSPDKRDQSPPRNEVPVTNTSPSSSLSLNKNRHQMRSSGRAAQMLGLCAPDKLKAIMNSDRSVESEDLKKSSSPMSTPARRNLRILYNSVGDSDNQVDNDKQINKSDEEDSENFLKFKRTLPSAGSSPAVPILKRKLADIADEATISSANKVSTCSLSVLAEPLHLVQ